MSRPKLAPIASAFCIFFVNNVGPGNLMTYDLAAFLNKAMATLVGVAIAVVVLRLVSLSPGSITTAGCSKPPCSTWHSSLQGRWSRPKAGSADAWPIA